MQKFKHLKHSFTVNIKPSVLAFKHNIISSFPQQPNDKRKNNSLWWLIVHSTTIIFVILFKPIVKTILKEATVRLNTQASPSCFGHLTIPKSMDNCLNFPLTDGTSIRLTKVPFDKAFSHTNAIMQALPHECLNSR